MGTGVPDPDLKHDQEHPSQLTGCAGCDARRRRARMDADLNNVETYGDTERPIAVWPRPEEQR